MELSEIMLSENDKRMLLAGLVRVISADGTITEAEEDFFSKLALGLNLQNVEIEEAKSQKLSFDKPESSMFFLTQAVQLCYVDGSYDKTEREELLSICKEINISEKAFKEVEMWVEEGIEWNNRGMKLLELR